MRRIGIIAASVALGCLFASGAVRAQVPAQPATEAELRATIKALQEQVETLRKRVETLEPKAPPSLPPAPAWIAQPQPEHRAAQPPVRAAAPQSAPRTAAPAPPPASAPARAAAPTPAAEPASPPQAEAPRAAAPLLPPLPPVSGPLAQMIPGLKPGWTQITGSNFRRVMATTGDRGTVGPLSVLIAWNNVAFDGESLYAHGGGHADYGGNEVYRYRLATLTWERMNEPAPYPQRVMAKPDGTPTHGASAERCPHPVNGPPSTHTYDSKVWSSAIKRLLVFAGGIAFCPSGVGERQGDQNVWAFDPVTKAWENLGPSPVGGLMWTAELPNGNIAVGNSTREAIYDPRTRATLQAQGGYPDEGDGLAVYDAKSRRVWISNRYRVASIALTGDYRFIGTRVTTPVTREHVGGINFDGSMAVDSGSGRLIRWGGKKHIVTINMQTGERRVHDFNSGPNGPGPLYERMFAVPGHDGVFLAVSNNADEGVWLFKMPAGDGVPIPTSSLQQQFDGGARSFTAGFYSNGLVINKGAKVDMAGARIVGAAGGKGAVVVSTSEPVTIENLTACGLRGGGNVAAIRAEGKFDLTVRNLHSCENEMGLLTDNRGGRLVVENSLIEGNGRYNGDKGHQLYAGEIDVLIVRNSVLRCARNFGHVLKSRARKMLIENSVLAQIDCESSRLIDASAGGENVIRNSVFQQGPNTDNAEMLAFGIELTNKQWDLQSSLVEGNTFISDVKGRPQSSILSPFKCRTEPKADPSGFVAPAHVVTARGNRFVSANSSDLKLNPSIYCSTLIASNNQEFAGRAAAGLPAFPNLPDGK